MEVKAHVPGTFSWIELTTTDSQGAKAFYGELFPWEFVDMPLGGDDVYTIGRIDGLDVVALYAMNLAQRASGLPPHWLSYATVEDVDATAARAEALGGAVLARPFDVLDAGRMAVLQDPTGATFAIWQARNHIGAGRIGEPHTLAWNELGTDDPETAGAYYTELFGWTPEAIELGDFGRYVSFRHGDRVVGGMYGLERDAASPSPSWLAYFAVEDCDAIARAAEALGGRIHAGPAAVPGVGRFAILADPQGAVFGILQPT